VNWDNFRTLMYILGGIAYVIGFFTVLHDVLDNGKSLEQYREKYGKDLGMALCTFYRALWPTFWPCTGFLAFLVGLVRDTVRLVMGKPVMEK